MSADDLRARVAAGMPQTIADLERLVRIPSKGYPGDDPANVRASAEATRDIFNAAGVDERPAPGARRRAPGGLRPDRRAGGRADRAPVRPPRRPAGRPARAVGLAAVRARGSRRPPVRARLRRRQVGGRDPRRSASGARRRRARHGEAPGRGRGGMLHRPPPPARGRERGSAPRRRGGDLRRRELPDGRPHDHDEHPRRHRLRGPGPGVGSGAAQRVLRWRHPGRDHGAGAHDLEAARRRRQRRDPRVAPVHLGGRRLPRGGLPRRSRDGRRAADDRHRFDRGPRVGGAGRRGAGDRRPGDPWAPRTRSCPWRGRGSACAWRPGTMPRPPPRR